MLMKTGIFYFTTCFHGFGILRHVDPFVRMLHIYVKSAPLPINPVKYYILFKVETYVSLVVKIVLHTPFCGVVENVS